MDGVRRHFGLRARAFDGLYDRRWLQRRLRPALFERQERVCEAIRRLGAPTVLDVGCGSGRGLEAFLRAGADRVIGVDFAPEMLALARHRLAAYGDRVELVLGSLDAELPRCDLVSALGFFEYQEDPRAQLAALHTLTGRELHASFPYWTWTRGPVRKLRYGLRGVPIRDFDEAGVHADLAAAGFEVRDGSRRSPLLLVTAVPVRPAGVGPAIP